MIRSTAARLALIAICFTLSACAPRAFLLRQFADELAAQGQAREDDLQLAQDAAPFYLKLSESVLSEAPGHLPLAAAVAGGFTQYAYAFVAFEAEKIESRDVRAAHALQVRAARLYRRALGHALEALEQRQPGFRRRLGDPGDARLAVTRDEVPLAYWAAAAWGARIALSKDDPEVVADLPLVTRLAQLAWRVDPDHGRGALATLLGTLEASRPGGDPAQARSYFDRALAASHGVEAGPYVAMAEALALPAGDRLAYETWLRKAQDVSARQTDLGNTVLRERAAWLLSTVADRF